MNMKRTISINDVFLVFAQYGFRKASMDDIATAAGISRQALYKRFKSKNKLFEWMVEELAIQTQVQIQEALSDKNQTVKERLVSAFDSLSGQHIDTLRSSPHGSEIFDKAIAITKADNTENNITIGIKKAITELLIDEGVSSSLERAEAQALTLYSASKGLMLTAESRSDFLASVRTVVDVLLD